MSYREYQPSIHLLIPWINQYQPQVKVHRESNIDILGRSLAFGGPDGGYTKSLIERNRIS